jgi:hypothetical protein
MRAWTTKASLVSATTFLLILAACSPAPSLSEKTLVMSKHASDDIPYNTAEFDDPVSPFTPMELWSRIKSLLTSYDGAIDYNVIEERFNVELPRHRFSDGIGHYYARRGAGPWYIFIGVIGQPGDEINFFSIQWRPHALKGHECLSAAFVEKELAGTEWHLVSHISDHLGNGYRYETQDGRLLFEVEVDCITSISFGRMK